MSTNTYHSAPCLHLYHRRDEPLMIPSSEFQTFYKYPIQSTSKNSLDAFGCIIYQARVQNISSPTSMKIIFRYSLNYVGHVSFKLSTSRNILPNLSSVHALNASSGRIIYSKDKHFLNQRSQATATFVPAINFLNASNSIMKTLGP